MSKLLIEEYPLMVLPSLACKIGLNEAIVLQQVHYWLQRSTTTADGHRWVYNSLEQWKAQFQFWSTDTVRRTIANLKERGLLIAECLSGNRFDRTPYYRINAETVAALECGNLQSSVASVDCKLQSPKTQKSADVGGKLQGSDGNLQPSDDGKLRSTLDKTETTAETTCGPAVEASEAVDGGVAPQAASVDDADQAALFAEDQNPGEQQAGMKAKPQTDAETVERIFAYWQKRMVHFKAQLSDEHRKVIVKALKMGYTPHDLCCAIQGCSLTPHNIGQNERGEKYDSIELILRNASQIDRFMANASTPPVSTAGMSKSAIVTAANAGLGARLAAMIGPSRAQVQSAHLDAAAEDFAANMAAKYGANGATPAACHVIDMGAVEKVAPIGEEPAEAVAESEATRRIDGTRRGRPERRGARCRPLCEFAKMRQPLGYRPRA